MKYYEGLNVDALKLEALFGISQLLHYFTPGPYNSSFFTLDVATTMQQMHNQLLAHDANSYTTIGSYHATSTPSV